LIIRLFPFFDFLGSSIAKMIWKIPKQWRPRNAIMLRYLSLCQPYLEKLFIFFKKNIFCNILDRLTVNRR